MSDPVHVSLPNQWSPRPYQQPLWDYLGKGGTRAVAVWHRRAGKDDVMLHHTACAAHERVGNYWYMLPEFKQCRKAIWDAVNPRLGKRRLDIALPEAVRKATNQQEMMIQLKNGSTIQLIGSDNYDALVGSTPIGVVFSEYALTNPAAWGFLRPILLENGGWAIFNGTPRGENHLKAILKTAKEDPSWFSQVLTVDDTRVFSKEQLDSELKEMQDMHGEAVGMALFMQEYYCSFNAAIMGAYYGEEMRIAEQDGRIRDVGYDDHLPVHTAWDLGYTDDTTIWFFQVVGGEIHLIDYHSSSGKTVEHYCEKIIKRKPYVYGTHYLPHDARAKTLGSGGKSVIEQLADHLGLNKMKIVPHLSLQDGIQAARMALKRSWFDSVKTEKGVSCLKNYQREWDDVTKVFKKTPKHDWSSHGADAFRMLAVAWQKEPPPKKVIVPKREFRTVDVPTITFTDMLNETVRRTKSQQRRI